MPTFRQLSTQHAIAPVGQLGIFTTITLELRPPGLVKLRTPLANAPVEMLAHPIRDEELCVWRPAITTLGQPDLLFAKRLPVRRARVLLVWRSVGDVAINNDQGRTVARVLESPKGALERFQVISVADACYIPAV